MSPKPGLVDRFHNGAHGDMDFFSFINSTAAIVPFFADCATAGFDYREKADDDDGGLALFESLRQGGRIAEERMREASGGANTHRGMIFSLGVISAAYGFLFYDDSRIIETCASFPHTDQLGKGIIPDTGETTGYFSPYAGYPL